MASETLVEVRDLTVRRGAFTLQIDEWQLWPGEVVGVVGPNGAGKTTLLESVAGLRPVTAGSVRVFDRDPWRNPAEVRTGLGFMSDDMPVFAMRIGKLLEMLSGYYASWDGTLAEQLLGRFDLDPRDQSFKLSKGQGTRLRLVVAKAFRPRILVLDEPATGLDVAGRRSLLESVLEVVRDAQRSVVVSSHMLADVERIADRLLVLDGGRVVKDGLTDQLVGSHRTLEEALLEWGAAG
jgi:ABC-2 type transport system ATP-binding protein